MFNEFDAVERAILTTKTAIIFFMGLSLPPFIT